MGQQAQTVSDNIPELVPLPYENETLWKVVKEMNIDKYKSFESLVPTLQLLSNGGVKSEHVHAQSFSMLKKAVVEYGEIKFFSKLLPFLIKMLKSTPDILKDKNKYKFLVQGKSSSIELTKDEVLCFITNQFFSTFNLISRNCTEWAINEPNFTYFLQAGAKSNVEKMKMILHYFERSMNNTTVGKKVNLRIDRIYMGEENCAKIFGNSSKKLEEVRVFPKGLIEDSNTHRQADFANQFIGGGVLQMGNVQEEIRFCVNPECLVSMVFCPCMFPEEAIIINGTERFVCYKGYGGSLKLDESYKDMNVGKYCISAMDALDFRAGGASRQWEKKYIHRELWKSYVAFYGGTRPISSGNWGCGAFRGDKELKFLIQWISSSQNSKKMDYYTFETLEPEPLSKKIKQLRKFVEKKKIGVKQLYDCIIQISKDENFNGFTFQWILKNYGNYEKFELHETEEMEDEEL